MHNSALIVFCHLRWDFVYQRPQHLLSRLATKRRVVLVEEPVHTDAPEPHWEKLTPEPNVTVYRPHTNCREFGFHPEQVAIVRSMLPKLIQDENLTDYVVWCYTAMATPLARELAPGASAVVHDCMDELSAFRGAPRELLDLEKELFGLADVVFTGGPSLYRSKKDRHANVHCFPSSVDRKHFGQARAQQELPEAPQQTDVPRPRLGFYGVIDERMDIELLDKMARAHPEWQIIMVGPVVKIDPESLPKHPNIHYFGQQTYQKLPGFLTGWDVCLMPFAMNESTKFISPTKVLEYMAAEKPIVSTPIRDVEEPYGDICYIGHDHDEFIAMCERALAADEIELTSRVAKMRNVLSRTSWDATADAMDKLIATCESQRQAQRDNQAAGTTERRDNVSSSATAASGEGRNLADGKKITTPVAVIGAGPTGLSAGYHLGDDAILIDQNDRVGGWCRSIQDRGFTFDYAGHIMFSNDPYVHDMYKKLLGDNVHWQNREAWIWSKDVYTRYPFQGALYGLPSDAIKDCIIGAIEARFGNLKTKADAHASKLAGGNGALTNTAAMNGNSNGRQNGQSQNGQGKAASNGSSHAAANGSSNGKAAACSTNGVKDCCADGIMESEVELVDWKGVNKIDHRSVGANLVANGEEPKNFEEFIYKVWGWGIAKHFAIPYNRKIWAVDLKDMETSWLGGRVPLPDLEQMIAGALEPVPAPMGPNARFGYPLRGGFQALMDGFLPFVRDRLLLKTRVVGVSPSKHTLTLSNGQTVRYDHLVSTMPLPVLVRMIGDEAPEAVRQAAAGLRHTSVRCVNIGVARENITDKHWIYYPEDTVFHRIFVQGNASPHCNPKGGFGFTCEITYSPHKPLPADGEELTQMCIQDCIRAKFIREDDKIICANQVDMPYAYVIYDHARPRNIKIIREWLAEHDILLAGRYSEWEYYNSDHAFVAGRKIAETVRELQAQAPATSRRLRADAADRNATGWTPAGATARSSSVRDKV